MRRNATYCISGGARGLILVASFSEFAARSTAKAVAVSPADARLRVAAVGATVCRPTDEAR
jgi:hypothetical protein